MNSSVPARLVRHLVVLVAALSLALTAAPAVADPDPDPVPVGPVATIHHDGDLRIGAVLSAHLDGVQPDAGSTFRWFADETLLSTSEPSLTIDPALVGAAVSVEITVPDTEEQAGGSYRSAPTPRVLGTAAPTIDGTPLEGDTLTAVPGTWTPGTTHTFQWFADGDPLVGATAATLPLSSSSVGRSFSVEVRGSLEGYGSVTEASAPSQRVQSKALPTISGLLLVGATLRAATGTWTEGTDHTYRWFADGKAITGARLSSFKLTKAQGGRRISVRVTGRNENFPTVAATSASTLRVVTAAAVPRISGAAAKGRTLTAKRGTWMKGMTVRYRWYADGVAIAGATRSKLVIPSSAVGKRITVRTTGSRSGYGTVTRASSATRYVQRVGKATLSGSTVATRRMRVSTGTWTSGTRFTYSWTLNGKKISGAKGSSVYVRPSWKGKRLRATVRGTKAGYSTFTSTTSSSAKVSLPGRTDPVSSWNCPSWAPIKGNESSMIYHMPHQRYYKATKPEDCFSTQAAARRAGYRKAKV